MEHLTNQTQEVSIDVKVIHMYMKQTSIDTEASGIGCWFS